MPAKSVAAQSPQVCICDECHKFWFAFRLPAPQAPIFYTDNASGDGVGVETLELEITVDCTPSTCIG